MNRDKLAPQGLGSRPNHNDGRKGKIMRFDGFWVTNDQGKVEVSAGEFDDTDLSDHSDWQEAWQNEDPEFAHGFIDPLSMLHNVSEKIIGKVDADELTKAKIEFWEGAPASVNDLHELAMLIQLLIPKAMRKPPKQTPSPTLTDDASDELPF